MSISKQKSHLRRLGKERRREAQETLDGDISESFGGSLTEFADGIGVDEKTVIAAYWPIGDEVDVIPAIKRLIHVMRIQCCLPIVLGNELPLIFKLWHPGESLCLGKFGTSQPHTASQIVNPSILLIPLLAYDLAGYRLGWGGGFYDRTITAMKENGHSIISIGVGYAAQQIPLIPRNSFDQPMDWILTEEGMYKVDEA